MELFNGAEKVRLQSFQSKYLVADEDAEHVSLDKRYTVPGSVWTAEYVVGDSAAPLIRLMSCYGRYLTATNCAVGLGTDALMVFQTVPGCLDDTIGWEPIPDGFQIKIKSHYGTFLSAWVGCVTHQDAPHGSATPDWFLWDVNPFDINVLSTASDDAQTSSSPKKKPSFASKYSSSMSSNPSTFCTLSKKKSPISLVVSPTNSTDDDDNMDDDGRSISEEETQFQESSEWEDQSSSIDSTARQGGGA